jgi:predicted Zn finger-like uncharacterized protein
MIVQCPDCTTRYELDDSRVPAGRIRVRCARCRYVFPIEAERPVSRPVEPTAAPAPEPGLTQDRWTPQGAPAAEVEPLDVVGAAGDRPAAAPAPVEGIESTRIESPGEPSREAAALDLEIERPQIDRSAPAAESAPAVATMAPDSPEEVPAPDPVDQKARRLARALVSDILVYNRDKRDSALASGTLVQALGTEIKKSWELYKERVTPEVATATNHFKDALNDILAEGQKVF